VISKTLLLIIKEDEIVAGIKLFLNSRGAA